MQNQRPKVLLFDLGGVIVRWTGIEALQDHTGLSRAGVLDKFSASQIFNDYEAGRCDDDVFVEEMIKIFEYDISPDAMKRLWQSWVGETYQDVKPSLTALSGSFTMACLSNTNALHWECLQTFIVTDDYFDIPLASHIMGLAKPDPEIYLSAIAEVGSRAEDIWFFDDTEINVHAAQECGIQAFHVDRTVGVVPLLKKLELLTV